METIAEEYDDDMKGIICVIHIHRFNL